MKTAARIAETFHIDPLMILNSTQEEWMIRLAAAKVIEQDNEARNREIAARSKKH